MLAIPHGDVWMAPTVVGVTSASRGKRALDGQSADWPLSIAGGDGTGVAA